MHRALVAPGSPDRATRPRRGGQSWPGSTSPPGWSTRCPPPPACRRAGCRPHRRTRLTLDADTTAALQAAARAHGLTLATVLYGAWALSVGALTGSARRGRRHHRRPAATPTSPVSSGPSALFIARCRSRLALGPDGHPRRGAAPRCRTRARGSVDHQQVRLGDLAARRPGTRELFDTLVVVENYPPRGGRPGLPVEASTCRRRALPGRADRRCPAAELALVAQVRRRPASVPTPRSSCSRSWTPRCETLAADPTSPSRAIDAARRPRAAASRSPSPARDDAAGLVRRAGRATPDAVAVFSDDAELTLRRAGRDRQPAGPPAARRGAGPNGCRRGACRARSELVGGAARRARGGRRLPAAGPRTIRPTGSRSCSPTPAWPR